MNLIPPERRPADVNHLPYFLLAGLIAITYIWLFGQFAAMVSARRRNSLCTAELQELAKQLEASGDLDKTLARAQQERDELTSKAAFVTVLSHKQFAWSEVLQAIAQTIPEQLRLTDALFDPGENAATLNGYGHKERADIEVASFLQALGSHPAIRSRFRNVRLDFFESRTEDQTDVKSFSISMQFREDGLARPPTAD